MLTLSFVPQASSHQLPLSPAPVQVRRIVSLACDIRRRGTAIHISEYASIVAALLESSTGMTVEGEKLLKLVTGHFVAGVVNEAVTAITARDEEILLRAVESELEERSLQKSPALIDKVSKRGLGILLYENKVNNDGSREYSVD